MRPGLFLAILLMLAPLLAPGSAQAQGLGVKPLDRLLPQIRRAYPGQFYDADGPTIGPDGQPHYHLKWMTPDGRIVWLDADARTGHVLRLAPGRDTFDAPRAPLYDFRAEDADRGGEARARASAGRYENQGNGGYEDRRPFDNRQYGNRPYDNRQFGGRPYDNRRNVNRPFGAGRGRGQGGGR